MEAPQLPEEKESAADGAAPKRAARPGGIPGEAGLIRAMTWRPRPPKGTGNAPRAAFMLLLGWRRNALE